MTIRTPPRSILLSKPRFIRRLAAESRIKRNAAMDRSRTPSEITFMLRYFLPSFSSNLQHGSQFLQTFFFNNICLPGNPLQLLPVVGHPDESTSSLLLIFSEYLFKPCRVQRIEAGGRLIQQQNPRSAHVIELVPMFVLVYPRPLVSIPVRTIPNHEQMLDVLVPSIVPSSRSRVT